MERLNPLDASFLNIEDGVPNAQMHVGSIGIFEGPPPSHDQLAEVLMARIHLIPRYRQVVETVPAGLGRPVWVDDGNFNVDYHLRQSALAAPGGDAELRRLIGRVMSQRLDRTKPLWEIWVVEGLEEDRWALISKIHHAMIDGVSGAEMMAVLLDLAPEVTQYDKHVWRPELKPNSTQLVADALGGLATSTFEQVRAVRSAVRRPGQVAHDAKELIGGLKAWLSVAQPSTDWSLVGNIGPHRDYTWINSSLGEIKSIGKTFGGTVNDVVLTAITGGFRHLLTVRGEDVAGQVVRTLVPVSVRTKRDGGAASGDGTMDNKVSAMIAELPVGVSDELDRLDAIQAEMSRLKDSNQAGAGEVITGLVDFVMPGILAATTRTAARMASGTTNLHTVTTNVPGPQFPLYSTGRRMLSVMPFVPLAAPIRIGVAVFSYSGQMNFGITGDKDSTDDIDVLAQGINDSLKSLADLAGIPKPEEKPTEEKSAAKKTPAKQTPAKKSAAKKATAKRVSTKKATAKKAPTKKSGAKKASAKKATAKKTTAKKATTPEKTAEKPAES